MNGNRQVKKRHHSVMNGQQRYCCPLTLFALLMLLNRFNMSRPRSRDYLTTGACGVTHTWRRCRQTSQRRYSQRHTDTTRFIAVSTDNECPDDNGDKDEEEELLSLSVAADDKTLSQLNMLHVAIINVWIFVDVLLLVRRLLLTVVAVRGIHIHPVHYDAMIASRDCTTWPSAVDQSHQPLSARQNGGPYYVPPPTSDDVITSRDLGSPEVVRVLGDVSLVYVAMSIGTVCLLVAALCACAVLLDHFLSAIARGSFLLPVSTNFRSAFEFLTIEARHLSTSSMTPVEPHYELTSLQHVLGVFNTGFNTVL